MEFRTFVLTILVFTALSAHALPPEGFEGFGIYKSNSRHLFISDISHRESYWSKEGFGYSVVANYLTKSQNSWSGGFLQNDNERGERLAYFLRYDFTFLKTQSVSLKVLRQDWQYLSAVQDSVGAEFTGFVSLGGANTGVYYSMGAYYRWLEQFSEQDDQGGFISFVLGVQKELFSANQFLTFDINNREVFAYQNADSWSTDLGLHFKLGNNKFLRFTAGVMWTAPWTYPIGFPASPFYGIGLVL